MNVLIVGRDGLASGLAWALHRDGVKVGMYSVKEDASSILKGIVEKVEDWEKVKDDYDMIVFEDTGFGKRADELKEDGYMVIGASEICDKLEMDREFATEVAKKMDVKIPETNTFTDWDAAIEFLRKNSDRKWVVKFNGLAGNNKNLLYVAEMDKNEDLIELLNFYKGHWNSEYGDLNFVLQEKIEGEEVGISGFFNGKEFVKPYYLDREYKKHLAGDVGVFTGQEGEAMFWTKRNTKIFNATLKRIEEVLHDKYIGSFNVNGILNEEGYWFLEFTPRFGYNSQSIEIEYFRRNGYSPLDWINHTDMDCSAGWAVGFVITVPPYPHGETMLYDQIGKGLPIYFEKGVIPHNCYLHDVEKVNDKYKTAGSCGYILTVASASSESIDDARKEALDTIGKIHIPKKQYRVDVGVNVKGIMRALEWK